ncbi:aldehyde dehydrogenase family protein [Streptomyces sp. NPDC006527]|uniref:aldehyde dehydrogenase family protein n=1 Tax=Streptomyces sp. NPDC006527 TaxID=3364749 RepID=UPI00369D6DCA
MCIAHEEIFDPVLVVIHDEAVRIVDDTDYLLQAQVFSSDLERAHRVARQVEAHCSDQPYSRHHEAPFGGSSSPALDASTPRMAWRLTWSRAPSAFDVPWVHDV